MSSLRSDIAVRDNNTDVLQALQAWFCRVNPVIDLESAEAVSVRLLDLAKRAWVERTALIIVQKLALFSFSSPEIKIQKRESLQSLAGN